MANGIIQVASTAGSLSGRVSRNGSVRATGYMGANYGVASGRVWANFGSGTWRAHMESGNCVGVWTAQRRQLTGKRGSLGPQRHDINSQERSYLIR